MRHAILLMLATLLPVSAQDVTMYSNTSEYYLLDIANTGTDGKILINGSSNASYGGGGLALTYGGYGTWWKGVHTDMSLGDYSTGYGFYTANYIGNDAYSNGLYTYTSAGTGGTHYGVNASVYGGEYATVYGVYSAAYNGGVADAYAGFFDGNVAVIGDCDPCSPSDVMFKKNIRDYSGGLSRILALKTRSYELRTDEFKGKMNLGAGTKVGFIAQEVEKVMPELVHKIKAPAQLSLDEQKRKVKKDPTEFRGMNYKELVPVLVQAMQEQQAQIEALKVKVAQLESR